MEGIHQRINLQSTVEFGFLSEMGIADGGQNRGMSQNLLYFQQINTCFN